MVLVRGLKNRMVSVRDPQSSMDMLRAPEI